MYFQISFMDTIQRNSQQYLASTNKIYLLKSGCKASNIMNNLSHWSSNEGFKQREKLHQNQYNFLHELI